MRLTDPATRERVKRDMDDANATTWENQWYGANGGDGVMLSTVLNDSLRKYEGMTLTEIGKAMGKDPRDAVIDLVIADRGESSVIISIMDEDDVRTALKHPLVGVGTDSGARVEDGKLAGSKFHPRGWGSFPRILGKYVREEHVLTLEEAVRKMTSKAAARVHLEDRGILRPGLMADITIFDPATIREVGTFNDPNHHAVGVAHVFVNGKRVVADGAITSERPGRGCAGRGRNSFQFSACTVGLRADSRRAESFMPAWLLDLFARYGYAVVFAGVLLENAGLPVPGETMLLAGAALASFGQLSLWWVIVVAIIGATCGDNLGFLIGRHGGRRLVERYGVRIGITRARLATFDDFFQRHGPKAVFVARFITGLRVVGAILAGGSTMRWPAFVFYNATGAIVWSTTIAFAGEPARV